MFLIEKGIASVAPSANAHAIDCKIMPFYWTASIGFFLGFAFGVGCALAVMYSIYMGGYRAAIRDSQLDIPPERYRHAKEKLSVSPKKD